MVLEKVIEILADQLSVDPSVINEDSNLVDDLGADSLAVIDLIMCIEDEFNVEVPDEEVVQPLKAVQRLATEDDLKKIEKNKEKVSSKEYIDWIYDYVSSNKHVDDESALYTYEGVDAENGQLLSTFLDYVEELSIQQRVLVTPDDECKFDSEQVTVKIKDKFFEIFRMYGQGSWTSVNLLDEEPEYAFVKIYT